MADKVNISEIVFLSEWYPRDKPSSSIINEYADALYAGAKFPPIALERGTNKLLDGYHRWKSRQKIIENPSLFGENGTHDYESIDVVYHDIPDGITPQLYAYSLSSQNGYRLSRSDTKRIAELQYKAMPGTPMTTLSKYLGISRHTAKEHIKHLVAEYEETKRTIIIRLHLLGWTQDEISQKLQEMFPDADGISKMAISRFCNDLLSLTNRYKNDFNSGHKIPTIAQRNAMPEILIFAMAMSGATDEKIMDELGIKVQPYDVWNFGKCHDLFGTKHPGRIPGQLVSHILYFYTKQGDMIVDPMAGSGTTLDVCLAMGRRCYGFDIDQRHERPDIITHNIVTNGWHERIKKADLILWDPPYFEKMDTANIGENGYIDGSISKLPRDEYLEFFHHALCEAKSLVKKGTKLSFLMSDWDDETGERDPIFIWDYASIIQDAGWKMVRHIQAPLSTQLVHPDIVNKFRASRRLARLERYLLIAEA